jgi:hypothetical protein
MTEAQVDVEDVLYVTDNVLVAEFPADMPLEDEVFAAVNERFEALAARPEVDTHVSVLHMASPLNSDVFERAQEAAAAGREFDITTWIIASEDVKNLALSGQVRDIDGVGVSKADSKAEALERARR